LLNREELCELYLNQGFSTYEIGKLKSKRPDYIWYQLRRFGIPTRNYSESLKLRHKKYPPRLISPNLEINSNMAYLFGVLLGDGWTRYDEDKATYSSNLKVTEIPFAKEFFNALKKIGLRPRIYFIEPSSPNHKVQFHVQGCSKIFSKWFKNLTLMNIEKLLETPLLIKKFLKGFYESEGGYHGNIEFWNTNFQLILLVQRFLKSLGFETSLHYRKRLNERWKQEHHLRILGGRNEAIRFLIEMQPCIKKEDKKIETILD